MIDIASAVLGILYLCGIVIVGKPLAICAIITTGCHLILAIYKSMTE